MSGANVRQLEPARAEAPVRDAHMRLGGGRLAARGRYDVALYQIR